MIFEYFPISSTISFFSAGSPSSFKWVTVKVITLSSPDWVMEAILPPAIYFLKVMQKEGAWAGEGLFSSVSARNGREALALISSLSLLSFVFTVNSSSSFSGCAILDILPPQSF